MAPLFVDITNTKVGKSPTKIAHIGGNVTLSNLSNLNHAILPLIRQKNNLIIDCEKLLTSSPEFFACLDEWFEKLRKKHRELILTGLETKNKEISTCVNLQQAKAVLFKSIEQNS